MTALVLLNNVPGLVDIFCTKGVKIRYDQPRVSPSLSFTKNTLCVALDGCLHATHKVENSEKIAYISNDPCVVIGQNLIFVDDMSKKPVELRMTYLSLFLIPSTLCLITPLFTIICLIECLITCFHYRMTTTSSFYLSPIWCIYRGLRATFNTTHESSFSDLIFRSTKPGSFWMRNSEGVKIKT